MYNISINKSNKKSKAKEIKKMTQAQFDKAVQTALKYGECKLDDESILIYWGRGKYSVIIKDGAYWWQTVDCGQKWEIESWLVE